MLNHQISWLPVIKTTSAIGNAVRGSFFLTCQQDRHGASNNPYHNFCGAFVFPMFRSTFSKSRLEPIILAFSLQEYYVKEENPYTGEMSAKEIKAMGIARALGSLGSTGDLERTPRPLPDFLGPGALVEATIIEWKPGKDVTVEKVGVRREWWQPLVRGLFRWSETSPPIVMIYDDIYIYIKYILDHII